MHVALASFVIMLLSVALIGAGMSMAATAPISPQAVARISENQRVPSVDVDFEGLSGMFGGETTSGLSEEEELWRDKYIYYHRAGKPDQCWPIPYANRTYNMLCYDGALTCCMALVFRDYTITIDSLYEEIVAKYGEAVATQWGHDMENGKKTIWPKTLMRYYAEERGLKWNIIEDGKDGKSAVQQMKEALLKGHPVVFGDGCYPMPFYADAEGTRTYLCLQGHTIMFYKYEDGIFWAKDTSVGPNVGGPKIAYREHGGKIDMESWAAKASHGYIGIIEYYVDETPSPKFPNIPRSMLYGDGDGKGGKTSQPSKTGTNGGGQPLSTQSEGTGAVAPAGTMSAEGVVDSSLAQETPDSVIAEACRQVPPSGGNNPGEWTSGVLSRLGVGVGSNMSPASLYDECCKVGTPCFGGTTETDPSFRSLAPGMVIAASHVKSENEAERVLGHCGIYVGNGTVMHDVGSVEEIPVEEFASRYGDVVPVGWGWAGGSPLDADGNASHAGSPSSEVSVASGNLPSIDVDGTSPIPPGYDVSDDAMRDAIAQAAGGIGVSGRGCVAHLMGAWSSSDSSTGVVGYLVEAEPGMTIGVNVFLGRDTHPVAVETRFLVIDGSTVYDVSSEEHLPVPASSGGGEIVIEGDFANMTPEEYLAPFLDPDTAIR